VSAAVLGFEHVFEPAEREGGPTLLLLHGTGGSEQDLLPLGRMLAPGGALLSPRGQVMENGMPRFFRRLAEGVFDQEDLRRRTGELGAFVRESTLRYGLDAARIVAVGFSNGANVAASLMLREPDVLAGGILLRAMVPFEPEGLAADALAGRRVLLSEGRMDPIVPVAKGERLAEILRGAGAEVRLEWQVAGHQLVQGDVAAARDWLGA
jgi:predicted esterase